MTTEIPIFERPAAIPDEIERLSREKGWPEDLLQQAAELRLPQDWLREWLEEDVPVAEVKQQLELRRTMFFSTAHLREATWGDNEALAGLFASAPERIGDWNVTVERSPYAFAQFRLQEHVQIQIVEDRGIALATLARSTRKAIVDGRRLSVRISLAARVREEARGKGYSNWVRMTGPALSPPPLVDYYYLRSQNFASYSWIKATNPGAVAGAAEREGDVPGLSVSVHCFPAQPFQGDATGIRTAKRSDLRRCLPLINRTHRGLDLFRPYTEEFLENRLDESAWGPKPGYWPPVYGWPDFWVLEEDGQIVACAGLWDRGRHLREVWRNRQTGEERTVSNTALMDFGYAAGREDAMARLIAYLLAATARLRRTYLMAPVEQLAALVARLERCEPVFDTRALLGGGWSEPGQKGVRVRITRPYTDLAYW